MTRQRTAVLLFTVFLPAFGFIICPLQSLQLATRPRSRMRHSTLWASSLDAAGGEIKSTVTEDMDSAVNKDEDTFAKEKYDAYKFGDLSKKVVKGLTDATESTVRSVTGDEDYKFGDLTAKAVGQLTGATDEAHVTGDEDYKFGDLTAKAVGQLTGATDEAQKTATAEALKAMSQLTGEFQNMTEEVVHFVTGDEDYKFGDYTNAILEESDRALHKIRDDAFNTTQVFTHLFGSMNMQQQQKVILELFQLAATLILTFNLISNACEAGTIVIAWYITFRRCAVAAALACSDTAAVTSKLLVVSSSSSSPLASASNWALFLRVRANLQLFTTPVLLPFGCAVTLFLFMPYRHLLGRLRSRLPLSLRRPVLNRAVALVMAWLLVNTLTVAAATGPLLW
eukprot:CAMPEP_0185792236 /NCGR_PEP_ID=MMETSP1174-20130828/158820_1 /TAXON_ID=35687 /ORGANISM="Dictyocha speculum, Strain CCMP1381" /LENGTH=395 /DNA_ID=CAMNT_0028487277 /DNA_START=34 /DNA_END=1219 /DNA_ORIENTATION=+